MNSYNENLNSNVVATLQAQELEQDNMQAQLNAAMFTLYYAEGAKITALEKLDETNQMYRFQQQVKEKALDSNNTAVNVLASANQSQQYVGLSAGNVATAAANVQVASNAVVRLASDMGSILSILNASQFGSPIYNQAVEVNKLLNDTAYNAGVTSQLAMEGSLLTASVSAGTVADIAKSTAASVTQMLSAASIQFDNTAALVAGMNTALADSGSAEKKAQGDLEDINVEFYASQASYLSGTKQMNLNLQVKPDKNESNNKYKVSFEPYLNPFYLSAADNAELAEYRNSPVTDYYIMLVKEAKKTTFSSTTAENLLDGNSRQSLNVKSTETSVSKDILAGSLLDSDGDAMESGRNYVIFVWAKFNDGYRKTTGNDGFLTAPSAPFALTNQLKSPKPKDIRVVAENNGQTLKFDVEPTKAFKPEKVEYRCLFLPDNSDLIKGLITESELRSLNEEITQREEIADQYDPIIKQDEATLISLTPIIAALEAKLDAIPEQEKLKGKVSDRARALLDELKNPLEKHAAAKESFEKNSAAKKDALEQIKSGKTNQPGLFFNKLLAEHVPAGSYSLSKPDHQVKKDDQTKISQKLILDDTTTDNFGNPLAIGKKYVPVVLTCPTVDDDNKEQFTTSLSDYQSTAPFIFQSNHK